MEVSRHPFYVFDFDERHSLLSFVWTERTAEMTDHDYQDALRAYARAMVEFRPRRALIDLRSFRHRVGDSLMSWRVQEIVPRYHEAGLERFAYVLPVGTPAPPDDMPAKSEPGEKFLTKRFGSERAAMSWLGADPAEDRSMSPESEGFHTITPQVVVRGASGAIELYKRLFGAVERVRILVPSSDRIFHAAISIGDTTLFLADETPGSSQTAPEEGAVGARFYLYVDDVDSRHRKATSAGMREIAAPEDMPWGDRMSIVFDRYGQMWSLAAHLSKELSNSTPMPHAPGSARTR